MASVSTSIVVLTHNKLACTRICLPTLLETPGQDWELIVVDNGSTDGTRKWLDRFRERCAGKGIAMRAIHNHGNTGCSTARNQGAAEASGNKLVFLDNDVALRSRSWLQQLTGRMDAGRKIAVAGPKLVYPSPPYPIQCAGVGISRTGRVLFRGRGEPRGSAEFNAEIDVQTLVSACFMFRRDIFEKAGGFDPAFNPVEFEDFDLCYRARSLGYSARYVPSVEMYHLESVTTAGTPSLPNTALVIRHGLLFKKRWKHMFEKEEGPPDHETRWRRIPPTRLDSVGTLPLIE